MPVAVIGAGGPVGRALVPLLAGLGSEVRAAAPDAPGAAALRAAGAKAAVARPDDTDTLWALLQDAHTLCIASTDPMAGDDWTAEINLGAARSAVEVAGRAGLRRVLMVSYPGASPDEPNPTLRALGLAEELVAGCGVEHLVVRCTHVIGAGSPWLSLVTSLARRRPAVVIGSGSQRLAPVLAEDVARVLAAADDRAQAVTGTVGLQGPEEITADRLVGLLAGPRRWKRHVDGVSGLGSAAADLLRRDSLADAPDAAAELGVTPGPFRPALSPSRAG